MEIIILGGFLGSGKSTVLLQLARFLTEGAETENQLAIIENEIGEVSIDDKLLSNQGYSVQTMFSGCVCCSIQGQLELGVKNIINDLNPAYIVIEASGVASPSAIQDNLKTMLGLNSSICALVDAERWLILLKGVKFLLEDQVLQARTILINKADRVDTEILAQIRESLSTMGATGETIEICATRPLEKSVLESIAGRR